MGDIVSLNETDDILASLFALYRTGEYVFRGISSEKQNNPIITRCGSDRLSNLSEFEFTLIHNFVRRAASHFTLNYDMLDYITCAQHYGVPTRFLDWTKDPFVALFFSINRYRSLDNPQFKIYYAKINDQIVIEESYGGNTWDGIRANVNIATQYKHFINLIERKPEPDGRWGFLTSLDNEATYLKENINVTIPRYSNPKGLVVLDPPIKNARLKAQRGLFSIPRSIKNHDSQIEVDMNADSYELSLGEEKCQEILKELDHLGYSTETLFPELESIGNVVVNELIIDN